MEIRIICPDCGSDAICRYGKTSDKKQRYLCFNCDRQFTAWSDKGGKNPFCPVCHRRMHVYMKHEDHIRYRCSHYPECDTYVKTALERPAEQTCENCMYWDMRRGSIPGVFGCCLCPATSYGVPYKRILEHCKLFETVRYYTCDHWRLACEAEEIDPLGGGYPKRFPAQKSKAGIRSASMKHS